MLMIGDGLNSYTIAAGEPWIMSVQMRANAGNAIIDWSQRRLVLSFYTAGRALKVQIEGVYTSDASGAYFAFVRDGSFSESLFGESLQVELAERLLNGRAIIATGALSIVPSSQGVTTFGAIIGRAEARFTIYFSTAGLISLIEQEILPYNIPIVAPPVTLGALSLSSTLRVGTASNGTIGGATDGSTITENIAGFTINSGARTYAYDGTGISATIADGLTETHPNATNSPRQSAVTVAAAPVTLSALSLAANSVTENAASGTVISGILGKTSGSTLSLFNDDGGRFAISGTNLVAGLTNIDYEAATSRSIVLRETLPGATSPRDTPLSVGVVNVNEQAALRTLLLSSTSLTVGTPANGAITEAATGSTITASGLPAGYTVNGPARTWAYDGSGPAANSTITLTEALGDSPNSPRATSIPVTVAASISLSALALSGPLTNGTASSGTITGATSGSTITSNVTGLTVNSGARTYSFDGTATAGTTANGLVEALAGATGSPRSTPLTVSAAVQMYVIPFVGSSSPARYLNETSGTANANVFVFRDTTGTPAQLTSGIMGMDMGNLMANATGAQIGFVDCGIGNTTLEQWEADGSTQRAAAVAKVNAAKAAGRVMPFALIQMGWNDVSQNLAYITGTPSQLAKLRSFISKFRAEVSLPNLIFMFGGSQDQPSQVDKIRYQREAEMQIANGDANCRFGFSTYDIGVISDGVHQTGDGQKETAKRGAASGLSIIQGTAQKRAAKFVSTTAISNTQTRFNVQHGDGTTFTPASGITGFRLFNAAGAEVTFTSAVRQSAIAVDVTHADIGTGGGTGIYQPNAVNDDNGTILRDNATLSLPFDVTATAISVGAAPVVVPALNALTLSGTLTNGTASSGTIGGLTSGSSLVSNTAGLVVNRGAATYSFDGTTAAGTTAASLTETLSGATGSPRTTSFAVQAASGGNPVYTATGKVWGGDYGDGSTAVAAYQGRSQNASSATPLTQNGTVLGWTETYNAVSFGTTGSSAGGRYQNQAMQSIHFNTNNHTFAGLDPAKAYDFEVTGSRAGATDRYMEVTVQSGVKQTLNTSENTDRYLAFLKIRPNAQGQITMLWAPGTSPGGVASPSGNLSIAIIREYSIS